MYYDLPTQLNVRNRYMCLMLTPQNKTEGRIAQISGVIPITKELVSH